MLQNNKVDFKHLASILNLSTKVFDDASMNYSPKRYYIVKAY